MFEHMKEALWLTVPLQDLKLNVHAMAQDLMSEQAM
jgi:hypothetical protein